MSEKIKLIIEINKEHYEATKKLDKKYPYMLAGGETAIAHGIPLDDVKARIIDNAFKDANETGFIFIGRLWRIFDNIIGKESEEK